MKVKLVVTIKPTKENKVATNLCLFNSFYRKICFEIEKTQTDAKIICAMKIATKMNDYDSLIQGLWRRRRE